VFLILSRIQDQLLPCHLSCVPQTTPLYNTKNEQYQNQPLGYGQACSCDISNALTD